MGTQLAMGWVFCSSSSSKHNDAYYAFEELASKFGRTVMLLNNMAACHIHMGQYREALAILQEAVDENDGDEDTFINLIVCTRHLGRKQEDVDQYLAQPKKLSPDHPWA